MDSSLGKGLWCFSYLVVTSTLNLLLLSSCFLVFLLLDFATNSTAACSPTTILPFLSPLNDELPNPRRQYPYRKQKIPFTSPPDFLTSDLRRQQHSSSSSSKGYYNPPDIPTTKPSIQPPPKPRCLPTDNNHLRHQSADLHLSLNHPEISSYLSQIDTQSLPLPKKGPSNRLSPHTLVSTCTFNLDDGPQPTLIFSTSGS